MFLWFEFCLVEKDFLISKSLESCLCSVGFPWIFYLYIEPKTVDIPENLLVNGCACAWHWTSLELGQLFGDTWRFVTGLVLTWIKVKALAFDLVRVQSSKLIEMNTREFCGLDGTNTFSDNRVSPVKIPTVKLMSPMSLMHKCDLWETGVIRM